MFFFQGAIRSAALRCVAILVIICGVAVVDADAITIVYDLEADGPEASTVDECPRLGTCTRYPIDGRISVALHPDRPVLDNVDSRILLPPDQTPPFSSIVWDNLAFLIGEYTSDALSADVSMRFFIPDIFASSFAPLPPLPPYELFVELTAGRSRLSLTGGYVGIALDPSLSQQPNSVSFFANGQAVPEPNSAVLLVASAIGIIASRRLR